jgi:predicted permease
MISASLLPLLRVTPALGRNFAPDEDQRGGAHVVLLSYDLWQRHYHGDAAIIGQSLNLDGIAYQIIGVLQSQFRFAPGAQLFVPLNTLEGDQATRGTHPDILAIGRLKASVSPAQARADIEGIARALAEQYPASNRMIGPALAPLSEVLGRNVRLTLLLLTGAVAFVLLIAIANAANLMLARGALRDKEMATRAALGATRGRLLRQLVVESLLLSLIGGALGMLLALWATDVIVGLGADSLPREATIAFDLPVFAFSLGATLLAGLLFGVVPALSASSVNLQSVLKEGDTRTTTGGRRRLRSVLVVAEVALSLILLVGAGLTIRAFLKLHDSPLGFQTDKRLTFKLSVPPRKYSDSASLRALLSRLQTSIAAKPGVGAAAISAGMPLGEASEVAFWSTDKPLPPPGERPLAVEFAASPSLLDTLGIVLLRGRGLNDMDRPFAEPVVVVDEKLARMVANGSDALGRQIKLSGESTPRRIVGIVHHVVNYGLGEPELAEAQLYVPYQQLSDADLVETMRRIDVIVKATVRPETLGATLAASVAEIDPDLPIYNLKTMNELVDQSLGGRRFVMALFTIFAGLALLLAIIGLYAVMSQSVSQRRREIAVRMALGAQPRDVEWLVLGSGLGLVGPGLVFGIIGSLALTGLMSHLLAGLSGYDLLTYVIMAVGLGVVALTACWLPARQAARLEPMLLLRSD